MSRARVLRLAPAFVLAVAAGLAYTTRPALAATTRHVSPTGSDTGDCSVNPCKTIGYAITQSTSGDTIRIAAGTYAEHVAVDRSLTLLGAGAGATIVDGSNDGTVITIGAASDSLTVTVSRLTVANGRAERGAGILTAPGLGQSNTVNLDAVVVSNNHASVAFSGGTAFGGGIYNVRGSMTVSRSTVEGNSAIGVTPLHANAASGYGGGIDSLGQLTIDHTTVSGNLARGGNGGCVFGCLGGLGEGGGILAGGTTTIVQSTVSGNEADGGESPGAAVGYPGLGGGIEGPVTLINSTVSGNTARGGRSPSAPGGRAAGGGIDATTSAVTLTNSTISANRAVGGRGASRGTGTGGGIDLRDGSAAVINTILAGNRADSGPNCLGTVTSGGHNLLGAKAGCGGFTGTGDQRGADPMLGPLQDNGGLTFTMALMPGSPAIASEDDSVCAAPRVSGVDQRDLPRLDEPPLRHGSLRSPGLDCGVRGPCDEPRARPPMALMLGPLQDNGGPTQTMALLWGKPGHRGG